MAEESASVAAALPRMAYRCRCDVRRTIESVSQESALITGYSPQQLILNREVSFAELIHPEDLAAVMKSVAAAVSQGTPFRHAYRIITASGTEKWVWEEGRPAVSSRGHVAQTLEGSVTEVLHLLSNSEDLRHRASRRARELSTLLEVSRNLTSTIDLVPLLGLVLDQLRVVITYTGAAVFRLNDHTLQVLAYRGPAPKEEMMRVRFDVETSRAHREVLVSGAPIVIQDVRGDEPLAQAYRESVGDRMGDVFAYVRSWMGIPLVAKDRVIGMLSLYHGEPNSYSPRHAPLALAFANQAAVAIEHARLYADARQRSTEMQTLYSVLQAVTSRLELEAVLQLVADEAMRLTSSSRAIVWLKEGDDLCISALAGEQRPEVGIGYRVNASHSVVGACLHTGHPVIVKKGNSSSIHSDYLRLRGVESFLSVPMISGHQAIGVISVTNKVTDEFSAADERVLMMLASGVVVALENARLYREEQQRRREAEQRHRVAEGLREILGSINASQPLDEILEQVATQASDLLGTDLVAIHYCQSREEPAVVHTTPTLAEDPAFLEDVPLVTRLSEPTETKTGPVVLSCPELAAGNRGQFADSPWWSKHCQTIAALPLVIRGEVRGGLELYYRQARDLLPEELRLAQALTDQAALAIDNAMLREQSKQAAIASERNRIARDLHDAVTQTLFSASLIAEVLPRLWERNPEDARSRLEELRQLARGALAEMRTLLLELRPATLTEVSLGDLLRQLVEASVGRSRIPVSLEIHGNQELPADVQVAMYRIAQEALNNLAKHSGASSGRVELVAHDGEVALTVEDNGQGFDPDNVLADHLGLRIMKERAESFGGVFRLDTRPGGGTLVKVTWSRPQEADGDD